MDLKQRDYLVDRQPNFAEGLDLLIRTCGIESKPTPDPKGCFCVDQVEYYGDPVFRTSLELKPNVHDLGPYVLIRLVEVLSRTTLELKLDEALNGLAAYSS